MSGGQTLRMHVGGPEQPFTGKTLTVVQASTSATHTSWTPQGEALEASHGCADADTRTRERLSALVEQRLEA